MGKNKAPKDVKNYTTPWQFPFDTPQLPKYGYDRPFNLPPPQPSIYDPDPKDIKEIPYISKRDRRRRF